MDKDTASAPCSYFGTVREAIHAVLVKTDDGDERLGGMITDAVLRGRIDQAGSETPAVVDEKECCELISDAWHVFVANTRAAIFILRLVADGAPLAYFGKDGWAVRTGEGFDIDSAIRDSGLHDELGLDGEDLTAH